MTTYTFANLKVDTSSAFHLPEQTALQAFGQIDPDQFRVSNKFSFAGKTPQQRLAFALFNGIVFAQYQNGGTALLNLVLKPIEPASFGGINIKYIIYRGIKTESLIDTALGDIVQASYYSGSVLSVEPNATLVGRIRGNNNATLPLRLLGIGRSLVPVDSLEDVFMNSDKDSSGNDIQYPVVNGGNILGLFNDVADVSIEVVIDDLVADYSIAEFTLTDHIVSTTGLSLSEKKAKKETILSYLDIGAFYRLAQTFSNLNQPDNYLLSGPLGDNSFPISELMASFINKNKIYLDIRNEQGKSLNYFEDNEGGGGNFKVATGTANISSITSATPIGYYDNGWPLYELLIDPAQIAGLTYELYPIGLAFLKNYNPVPVVYANGHIVNAKGQILNDQYLFQEDNKDENNLPTSAPATTVWSKGFTYYLPITGGESFSVYLRLYVNRRYVPSYIPPTALKRDHYLDNLFGPLIPFEKYKRFNANKSTFWGRFGGKRYVRFGDNDMMVQLGAALSNDHITLYAEPTDFLSPFSFTNRFALTEGAGNVGFFNSGVKNFLQTDKTPIKITLVENGSTVYAMGSPSLEGIGHTARFTVSFTKTEYDRLYSASVPFTSYYPNFINFNTISLFEDASAIGIKNLVKSIFFTTIKLSVSVFDLPMNSWNYTENVVLPVFIRTLDSFYYSSNDAATHYAKIPNPIEEEKAYITTSKLIDYLQIVEDSFNDADVTFIDTITRMRSHYYGNTYNSYVYNVGEASAGEATLRWLLGHGFDYAKGLGFEQSIPEANYYENHVRRNLRGMTLNFNREKIYAYERLTSHANENGKADNPSPYIVNLNSLDNSTNEYVDLGHAFYSFEALYYSYKANPNYDSISPTTYKNIGIGDFYNGKVFNQDTGIGYGYKKFNVYHPYDLGGLLADIAIAGADFFYDKYYKKDKRLKTPIGYPETTFLDGYYKESAPDADLLSDLDGVGLYHAYKAISLNSAEPNKILTSDIFKLYYNSGTLRHGLSHSASLDLKSPYYTVYHRYLIYSIYMGFVQNINGTYHWIPTKTALINVWEPIRDAWRLRIFFFMQMWCGQRNSMVTFFDKIMVTDKEDTIYAFRDSFPEWKLEDDTHIPPYTANNYPNPIDGSSSAYYRGVIKDITVTVFETIFLEWLRKRLRDECIIHSIPFSY